MVHLSEQVYSELLYKLISWLYGDTITAIVIDSNDFVKRGEVYPQSVYNVTSGVFIPIYTTV